MSQAVATPALAPNSPRGRVLAGTALVQLGLGTIYAWGIVNPALANRILGDASKVFPIAITFSIMMMSLSLATLSINFLQRRFGVRNTIVACGIVIGGGMLITAFTSQLWMLYLFAGVLVGAADGIGYLLSLTNVLRWYPDKPGSISGISIGSYGITAVILPFILGPILGNAKTNFHGLTTTFIVWGAIALVLIVGGGLLLKDAPVIQNQGTAEGASEYTIKQMLHTPQAYMLFFGISIFCFAGLFIIGHGGDAAIKASNPAAYLIGTPITLVSLIGLVNTSGRFFFGWLSDRVSRTLIVAVALSALAIFAFLMGFTWNPLPSPILYIIGFLVFGAAFGGCITIYPTIVGDFFGKNSQSKNYSIIYQGMAVGAAITLIFNVLMAQAVLTFGQALIIGGVLEAIAAILLFVIRKPGPAPVEK